MKLAERLLKLLKRLSSESGFQLNIWKQHACFSRQQPAALETLLNS